jgi:hypothetical protein
MIRIPLLSCLALLLASAAAAQEPGRTLPDPGVPDVGAARLVARLPVPAGGRAASGALSPDGERYVFGAAAGGDVQLWLLELRTRELRLLTPGPGRRHDPVWSPDGGRLAYWGAEGLDGIYVLDLADGRERRVWVDSAARGFAAEPRWIGGDSLRFQLHVMIDFESRPELWMASADGGGGRRAAPNDIPAHRLARDPRGTPRFGTCCGGGWLALWVDPPGGSAPPRCVAGPLGSHREAVWAGPAGPLAFAATTRARDTLFDLYAADPAQGGARRVRAPRQIAGLTGSSRGDVALLVHPAPQGPSELWIIPAGRLRGDVDGDTLAACPEPPPEIGAFLRAQGIPDIRSVTVLVSEPRERLAFFRVVYGMEIDWGVYPSWVGVAYGGRVGWVTGRPDAGPIEPPAAVFDIRPGDAYLYSRELLGRLDGTELGREWMALLLADEDTPDSLVTMLADSAVRSASTVLADQLFALPEVRESHRRLWQLAGIPWSRGTNPGADLLWHRAPQVIADPESPEPLLFLLAEQLPGPRGGRPESAAIPAARALAANPVARRSIRIQQRLALLPHLEGEAVSIRRAAAERLLADPQATEALLAPVLQLLVMRDSASTRRLLHAPAVRRSALLTSLLASPYAPPDVRLLARERVLADSAAPGPALVNLLPVLLQQGDSIALAVRVVTHPAARENGPLLGAVLRETPLYVHPTTTPAYRLRQRVEGLLAEVLRDPRTDERELYRVALELQESSATTAMLQLLENPRARRCATILEQVSMMTEFRYHPPTGPYVPDPPAREVKARARRLLDELAAAGPPPSCDVGPHGTAQAVIR